MKNAKRAAVCVLTVLLLFSAIPGFSVSAFGTENGAFRAARGFIDDNTEVAPLPDAPGARRAFSVSSVPPVHTAGVRPTAGMDDTVDWDGVKHAVWEVLYTELTSVDISSYNVEASDGNRQYLYNCGYYDPAFLRLGVGYTVRGGMIVSVDYDGDWETNRAKYDACMKAIDTILYGVEGNDELSDLEKCLLVHDRLAVWCEYDYDNYTADTLPEDAFTAYGALAKRIAVCNGIALAYGWMLDILGIPNSYTSSQQINHGWTRVVLDGEPYYVDVTWDDPVPDTAGRVLHENFMQSFATFSAGHRNADDFDRSPVSTVYEDLYVKETDCEILYINGSFYYLRAATGELVRREHDGTETVVKTLDRTYTYTDDSGTYTYEIRSGIAALGDQILYLAPREVRAWDTVTGEDVCVFTPDESIYPDPGYTLTGLQQIDGVIYATSGHGSYTQTEKPAQTACFPYCSHADTVERKLTKGANCAIRGDRELICADCGRITSEPGEGAYGDHSFLAAEPVPEALKAAATCTSPEIYYYSCTRCGAPETGGVRTFSYGAPLPHTFTAQGEPVPATPACPGYTPVRCRDCGLEINSVFTFYEGSTACGALNDTSAWQIVNGVLYVYGQGALPDFTEASPAPWKPYAAGIRGIYVNDGVNAVGAYNFFGLGSVSSLHLPDGIVSIGRYAFGKLSSLTSFTCPAALTAVGPFAFYEDTRLAEIGYNGSIACIGEKAFASCSALTRIVIPGTVSELGYLAFGYCNNVRSIVIEEGLLRELPSFYFNSKPFASMLDEIKIPACITEIGVTASFNSLTAAKRITVDENNPYYASVDGVLFTKDLSMLVKYPNSKDSVYYTAPETVARIGKDAFYALRYLQYLDLSATAVTSISDANPIEKTAALQNVNLPAGLTSVTTMLFEACELQSIYIPSSVTDVFGGFITGSFGTVYTDSAGAAVVPVCAALNIPCTVLENHTHTFSTAAYRQDGDCASPGALISTCACGQFRITALPGHSFTAEVIRPEALRAEANCVSGAVYYYSCAVCGAVADDVAYTFVSGSPTAEHNYTAQTVKPEALKTEATCVSAAVYYYSCTVCGAVEGDGGHTFVSGAPASHNWEWRTDVPAACSAPGVMHEECAACHARRSENTPVPATGVHSWDGGAVTSAPDCFTEGVRTYTCAGCGKTRIEPVERTSHADADGDGCCDICGARVNSPGDRCDYCGNVHGGYFGRIIRFFHNLLYRFAKIGK